MTKVTQSDNLYQKLDTCDGEHDLYHLTKARHHKSNGFDKFYGINGKDGRLILDWKKAQNDGGSI